MADVVVDASALVDLLLGNDVGLTVRERLSGRALQAPAHVDSEVLSALGRMNRAGAVEDDAVEEMLAWLAVAPIQRQQLAGLLRGAWSRRHNLRLADALYVELAAQSALPLVTTDRRLRGLPAVEVVA